jgi:transposase-like protein
MTECGRKAWRKWQKVVCEQGRSGQSVAAFCRERGVCAPQFFAWKKRLRQTATPRQPQGNEAAQFVEVKLAAAGPEARAACGTAIEVRLQNGRSLLVGPGFDAQHLRALLAVVETAE